MPSSATPKRAVKTPAAKAKTPAAKKNAGTQGLKVKRIPDGFTIDFTREPEEILTGAIKPYQNKTHSDAPRLIVADNHVLADAVDDAMNRQGLFDDVNDLSPSAQLQRVAKASNAVRISSDLTNLLGEWKLNEIGSNDVWYEFEKTDATFDLGLGLDLKHLEARHVTDLTNYIRGIVSSSNPDDHKCFWEAMFSGVEETSMVLRIHALLPILGQIVQEGVEGGTPDQNVEMSIKAGICYMTLLQVPKGFSWNTVFRQVLLRKMLKSIRTALELVPKTGVEKQEDDEEPTASYEGEFQKYFDTMAALFKKFPIGTSVDSIIFAIQDLCLMTISPKSLAVANTAFRSLKYLIGHFESYVERDEEADEIENANMERRELEAGLGTEVGIDSLMNGNDMNGMMNSTGPSLLELAKEGQRKKDEALEKLKSHQALARVASTIFKQLTPAFGCWRPGRTMPATIPRMWKDIREMSIQFAENLILEFPDLCTETHVECKVDEDEFESDEEPEKNGAGDKSGGNGEDRSEGIGDGNDLDKPAGTGNAFDDAMAVDGNGSPLAAKQADPKTPAPKKRGGKKAQLREAEEAEQHLVKSIGKHMNTKGKTPFMAKSTKKIIKNEILNMGSDDEEDDANVKKAAAKSTAKKNRKPKNAFDDDADDSDDDDAAKQKLQKEADWLERFGCQRGYRRWPLDPIVALLQALCLEIPEKQEIRTFLCDTASKLVVVMPEEAVIRALIFALRMLTNPIASRRVICAELAAQLLDSMQQLGIGHGNELEVPEDDEKTEQTEREGGNRTDAESGGDGLGLNTPRKTDGLESNNKLKTTPAGDVDMLDENGKVIKDGLELPIGEDQQNPENETLTEEEQQRRDLKKRAQAQKKRRTALFSSEGNKMVVDFLWIIKCVEKLTRDVAPSVRAKAMGAVATCLKMVSEDQIQKIFDKSHDNPNYINISGLFTRNITCDKPIMRRAALTFFDTILPLRIKYGSEKIKFCPKKLATLLQDDTITVRKQAIGSMSAYLRGCPSDPLVLKMWIRGIIGAVTDVEETVREKALDEIANIVFTPLVKFVQKPKFIKKDSNGNIILPLNETKDEKKEEDENVDDDPTEMNGKFNDMNGIKQERKSSQASQQKVSQLEDGMGPPKKKRKLKKHTTETRDVVIGVEELEDGSYYCFDDPVFNILEMLDCESAEYLQRAISLYGKRFAREPFDRLCRALGGLLRLCDEKLPDRRAWPISIWALVEEVAPLQANVVLQQEVISSLFEKVKTVDGAGLVAAKTLSLLNLMRPESMPLPECKRLNAFFVDTLLSFTADCMLIKQMLACLQRFSDRVRKQEKAEEDKKKRQQKRLESESSPTVNGPEVNSMNSGTENGRSTEDRMGMAVGSKAIVLDETAGNSFVIIREEIMDRINIVVRGQRRVRGDDRVKYYQAAAQAYSQAYATSQAYSRFATENVSTWGTGSQGASNQLNVTANSGTSGDVNNSSWMGKDKGTSDALSQHSHGSKISQRSAYQESYDQRRGSFGGSPGRLKLRELSATDDDKESKYNENATATASSVPNAAGKAPLSASSSASSGTQSAGQSASASPAAPSPKDKIVEKGKHTSQEQPTQQSSVSFLNSQEFSQGTFAFMNNAFRETDLAVSETVFKETLTLLDKYLFTLGELYITEGAKIPPPRETLVMDLISIASQNVYENGMSSNNKILMDTKVRAQAFGAIGKLCCKHEKLAKRYVEFLVLHLDKKQRMETKNNILITLCDLAKIHTSLVDPHVCHVSEQLRASESLLRRQAAMILSSLLAEDFIKFKGTLVHRLFYALSDPNEETRYFVESVFCKILVPRAEQLFANNFVDCICAFNEFKGLATFQGAIDNESFSLLKKPTRRAQVYRFMLSQMSAGHRYQVTGTMVQKVLASFLGGDDDTGTKLPLPTKVSEPAGAVLYDCLVLLKSKEMKLIYAKDRGPGDIDDGDEEQPGGQPAGEAAAAARVAAAAKKAGAAGSVKLAAINMANMVSLNSLLKKNLGEVVIPTLLGLKQVMEQQKSPFLRDLIHCFREIIIDFKDELGDMIQNQQTAKELAFDLELDVPQGEGGDGAREGGQFGGVNRFGKVQSHRMSLQAMMHTPVNGFSTPGGSSIAGSTANFGGIATPMGSDVGSVGIAGRATPLGAEGLLSVPGVKGAHEIQIPKMPSRRTSEFSLHSAVLNQTNLEGEVEQTTRNMRSSAGGSCVGSNVGSNVSINASVVGSIITNESSSVVGNNSVSGGSTSVFRGSASTFGGAISVANHSVVGGNQTIAENAIDDLIAGVGQTIAGEKKSEVGSGMNLSTHVNSNLNGSSVVDIGTNVTTNVNLNGSSTVAVNTAANAGSMSLSSSSCNLQAAHFKSVNPPENLLRSRNGQLSPVNEVGSEGASQAGSGRPSMATGVKVKCEPLSQMESSPPAVSQANFPRALQTKVKQPPEPSQDDRADVDQEGAQSGEEAQPQIQGDEQKGPKSASKSMKKRGRPAKVKAEKSSQV